MTDLDQKSTEILLEGISKTFHDPARGTVNAVKESDLVVKPGELMTLLGPSGCGKTTLLRLVAGFEEPTTGRIVIAGKDQTNVMANKRDIGFVFQNYALFPHLSVFDNVAYGPRLKQLRGERLRGAVRDVLDLVGLTGMDKRYPNQLSGGEQQRVALARVIVTSPSVLLFDEPLSNLDAKRRVQMREDIRRLQKHLSITSLYVTHDQEEALAISDRIVVMSKGQIEQIGTPQELYSKPRSVFVANFVGRSNTFYTKVDEVIAGDVRVTIAGVSYLVATTDGAPHTKGEDVAVLIRPEAVALHGEAPQYGDGLRGVVKVRTYLGEKVEYQLDLGEHELVVTVYDPQKNPMFEVGQQVFAELLEGRMAVVGRGKE